MPSITPLATADTLTGTMTFLADMPRYRTEKPCVYVPPAKPLPVNGTNPPNVKRDVREGVIVEDVRAWKDQLKIDTHGFQVLEHHSEHTELDSQESVVEYKRENQDLLQRALGAERVFTWGLRKRMPGVRQKGEEWDYWNEIEIEQPAVMAHCDFTYERGRVMVEKFLGKEATQKYIDDGYRIRIVNTWRPLVPVIEKQPLAICDPRSVELQNLIKCDRVLVDDLGEITLLQYTPEQKWYWLRDQTTSEPFIFCTWDSTDPDFPDVVRHSPHVSFEHGEIRADAPARFSVESRSIVVTKD